MTESFQLKMFSAAALIMVVNLSLDLTKKNFRYSLSVINSGMADFYLIVNESLIFSTALPVQSVSAFEVKKI